MKNGLIRRLREFVEVALISLVTEHTLPTKNLIERLIAFLLLQVIQSKSESTKVFSIIAALIRMHLISHLNLMGVATEGKAYIPQTFKEPEQEHNKRLAIAVLMGVTI